MCDFLYREKSENVLFSRCMYVTTHRERRKTPAFFNYRPTKTCPKNSFTFFNEMKNMSVPLENAKKQEPILRLLNLHLQRQRCSKVEENIFAFIAL
jgi:hypothetical protein